MQALHLIRQLRFQLQLEIDALPECFELENIDRVLSIYEQLVVVNGLEHKRFGHEVQEAFENLIAIAREGFLEQKPTIMFPRRKIADVASKRRQEIFL